MGWRVDLILRAERLECGVYGALTFKMMLLHDDAVSYKADGNNVD
ncbi:hypothetical protein A6A12_2638 [Vibrio anguillarum]|nr:hypothetical protein A6A12_2638 [Vibrio anguillarum]